MSRLPHNSSRRWPGPRAWAMASALSLALVAPLTASAQTDIPLVVFGDSLSDPGNGFALLKANATPTDFGLNELLAPSAPYAIGGHHLSNGETWIEQLAAQVGVGRSALPAFASANPYAMNFAIGTARARHDGQNPSLAMQIGAFLQKTGGVAQAGALYVIQIGGNDVRDAVARALAYPPRPDEARAILEAAAVGIANGVRVLYAAGARHFLVWNVPNPAVTPAVRHLDQMAPGTAFVASFATAVFNTQDLGGALTLLDGLPGVMIRRFNADALVSAIVFTNGGPFGLTNVTDACVTPASAPFTCHAPDQYLFWDGLHPTKAAHALIARAVAQLFGL